ncbi:MAG: hypothetical protein K8S23_10725 [Candidatus Cloacimonetes bacterium]|nr:hypothetical protein [Candidatus Cloacimonadota bacterium]
MKRIALVKDKNIFWTVYKKIIESFGFSCDLIDIWQENEADKLFSNKYDGLIWRAKHTPKIRDLARKIINIFENELNIPCWPDWNSFSHYDDKVMQYYILKAKNIATPKTSVFYNKNMALEYLESCKYPFFYKSSTGAGASNVGLIKSKGQGKRYIAKVFGKGLKTYFEADVQKDYVYFQEFLSNNKGDYKILCFGDQIQGFFRANRPNSIYASGSNNIILDKLPEKLLNFVESIHEKLSYDIMSYDIMSDFEENYVVTEFGAIWGDLKNKVYDEIGIYRKKDNIWIYDQAPDDRHFFQLKYLFQKWGFVD